ncbi:hypothetical protein GCM10008025_28940 [Ornithinibacillus halotolerans]|uniref:Uncharacterized protein n=1 Tax=Ornithinibacillus halotolerans TaxID=1274357 RepID=A0A916S6J9_9BACI|nr:hypothetical protein GCM10008025_28940 [Ornithinibacillus halotolerans]
MIYNRYHDESFFYIKIYFPYDAKHDNFYIIIKEFIYFCRNFIFFVEFYWYTDKRTYIYLY